MAAAGIGEQDTAERQVAGVKEGESWKRGGNQGTERTGTVFSVKEERHLQSDVTCLIRGHGQGRNRA